MVPAAKKKTSVKIVQKTETPGPIEPANDPATLPDLDPDQPMDEAQREACLRRYEQMGEPAYDAALNRVFTHKQQRLDAAHRVTLWEVYHPYDFGFADLAPVFDAYVPPRARGGALKPVTVYSSPVATPVKMTLGSSP